MNFEHYVVYYTIYIYFEFLDLCFRIMKFQQFLVCLSIAAICLFATVNAGIVLRMKRSPQDGGIDFCAEDTEFPAWKNFYAFVKWCEDGTVGAKPPPPEE